MVHFGTSIPDDSVGPEHDAAWDLWESTVYAHLGGLLMGVAWTWIYGPFYTVPPQVPVKDENGIGTVRAIDTQPLSRGRLWGVFLFIAVLGLGCLVLKLGA